MEVQDKDLQVDQVVVLVVVNIVKLEEQVMFNLHLQYKDFLVDSHHPHLHPLIQEELVEEEGSLVFVLLGEVESLTAARAAAVRGNEPSDAIRAVNSLLTHLDALKAHPNVVVMATSNVTEAIDVAFLDRADIKAYIGPPTCRARYEILRSCVNELRRADILDTGVGEAPPGASEGGPEGGEGGDGGEDGRMEADLSLEQDLWDACEACEGMSGRMLRKLPFLTHASGLAASRSTSAFLRGMRIAAENELCERGNLT